MSDETNSPNEAAPEKKRLDIINGRLPLVLVYLIRFESGDMKDTEVAQMYKTSTGKVSDIRKNRNFAYITEDTKFSQADLDAALAHIQKPTLEGNHVSDEDQEKITRMIGTFEPSETAEADISAARKAVRKTKSKDESEGGEGESDEDDPLADAV